jgi:hypothetical protein
MVRPRVFSNLSLHEAVPARAQPAIGEWGPARVVATQRKRRARILWPIVCTLVAAVLITVGYLVHRLIVNAVGI